MDIARGVNSVCQKAMSGLQAYGSYKSGDMYGALRHGASAIGGTVGDTVSRLNDTYNNFTSTAGALKGAFLGFSGARMAAA